MTCICTQPALFWYQKLTKAFIEKAHKTFHNVLLSKCDKNYILFLHLHNYPLYCNSLSHTTPIKQTCCYIATECEIFQSIMGTFAIFPIYVVGGGGKQHYDDHIEFPVSWQKSSHRVERWPGTDYAGDGRRRYSCRNGWQVHPETSGLGSTNEQVNTLGVSAFHRRFLDDV